MPRQSELISVLTAVALGGLIGLVVSVNAVDLRWAIVLALVYLVIGITYTHGHLRSSFLLKLFIAGYIIRVALAFILYSLHPPVGHIFRDDLYYMETGLKILHQWQAGQFLNLDMYRQIADSRNWGYSLYDAFHFAFAPSHLLPMISNAFFGTLIGIIAYRIARELLDRRIARLSAVLVVFYPSFIFFSAVNLKDILVAFMVALVVLYGIQAARDRPWSNVIKMLLAVAVLHTLRFYIAWLLLGLVVLYWIIQGYLRLRQKLLLIAILIVIAVALSSVLPGVQRTIKEISRSGGLLEVAIKYSERSFTKIAGKETTILGLLSGPSLRNIAITGARFMLNPSPFNLHDLTYLLLPGVLLWYFLIPYFITGTLSLLRRKPTTSALLLCFALSGIALYSLLPYLTDMRHRLQFIPAILIIAAYGIKHPWRGQFWISAAIWAALLFGIAFLKIGVVGL